MAIVERDFIKSPKIQFIARKVGWHRQRVLGAILIFWEDTQHNGIVSAPRQKLEEFVEADSDDEVSRLLDAMLLADLLEANGDELRIKGNQEHVDALEEFRAGQSERGKRRAAGAQRDERGRLVSSRPANYQPVSSRLGPAEPAASSPASVSVSVSNKEETKKEIRAKVKTQQLEADLVAPERPAIMATIAAGVSFSSGASPPDGKSPVARFRDDWLREHQATYPNQTEPVSWGSRENGQVAQLLRSDTIDTLRGLIGPYHHWKNPRVIAAGHPFCKGADSFVMQLDRLKADLAHPERHRFAGAARVQERKEDASAYTDSVYDELERRLEQRQAIGQGNQSAGQVLPAGARPGERRNLAQNSASARGPESVASILARAGPPQVVSGTSGHPGAYNASTTVNVSATTSGFG